MYIRVSKDVLTRFGSLTLSKELVTEFVSYMRRYPALYQRLSQQIINHLPTDLIQPCIIDIGCGPGLLLEAIARSCSNSILIGIDISNDMLFYARQQLIMAGVYDDASLLRSRVETLPCGSERASVVVSRFSLPYWDDTEQGFREISRVLTEKGWLILDALDPTFSGIRSWPTLLHMRYAKASRRVMKYHRDSFTHAYAKKDIYALLEQAGLYPRREKTKEFGWHYEIYAKKK